MSNKKTSLQNIQFAMVGFLLIASGNGIIDHKFLGYTLIVLGSLLLIYSLYNLVRKKSNFNLKLLALSCESVGLFTTSFILFDQGSKYLPYPYLLGGIAILIGIIIHIRRHKKEIALRSSQ